MSRDSLGVSRFSTSAALRSRHLLLLHQLLLLHLLLHHLLLLELLRHAKAHCHLGHGCGLMTA
jgi:hypothetical protein